MKTYEVYFTEPVEIRYQETRWNSENRELETVEVCEADDLPEEYKELIRQSDEFISFNI